MKILSFNMLRFFFQEKLITNKISKNKTKTESNFNLEQTKTLRTDGQL